MGIDITSLIDFENAKLGKNEILDCLNGIFSEMQTIWGVSVDIPVNTGFKALDLEQFKRNYFMNWEIKYANLGSEETNKLEGISCHLRGPYGYTGEIFKNTLVLDHATRWAAFKDDDKIFRRFIATAQLMADALQSTTVIFMPDSTYPAVSCLDHLSEGCSFQELLLCFNKKGARLEPAKLADSQPESKIYVMKVE